MSAWQGPEISLVLPCYNEREGITAVLARSAQALERLGRSWELLVIDNHSSDGTPEVGRDFLRGEHRGRLLVHETNRYYSGSCQTALTESRGRHIAIMDSDGQFTADDLPLFLEALAGGANLVFGWRRQRHDPLSRKLMSKLFNAMARHYLGCSLHDLNVGLRVFDRQFQAAAEVRHRLNLANPELYVCARRAGLVIGEVPVKHFARQGGRSCHDPRKMWGLLRTVHAYFRSLRDDLRGLSRCEVSRSGPRAAA
jgi:glycosyltransferase involved in cell wall biosynthesis